MGFPGPSPARNRFLWIRKDRWGKGQVTLLHSRKSHLGSFCGWLSFSLSSTPTTFQPCFTAWVHAKSLQSCPTLCDPMDCSPPSSSVHGTLQARTLEWGAMPSSRGSSPPRDQAHVSCFSCIGSQVLYHYRHLVSTKKMWHMYTMKYYAIIKRNKIRSFAATYIQLLIIILSEIKSEKHNLYCFHLYVESKLWHKWTYIQNRKRLIDIEIRLVFAKAEEKQRDRLGIWDW